MFPDPIEPTAGAFHGPDRPCERGPWPAALPCARIGGHGRPQWVSSPSFSSHLAVSNAVSARAAAFDAGAPVPFSRWLERTNREDRVELGRVAASLRSDRECPAAAGADRLASLTPPTLLSPAGRPLESTPRLGEVLPLPAAARTEIVRRAYSPSPILPRGMTMDVLA